MDADLDDLLQQKHIKALILDMDGVVTQTETLHAQAWKRMFDDYLLQRGNKENKTYEALSIATDYRQHIDGIPRGDGVRNFLASRGIILPEGTPEDAPGRETVTGLGKRKNLYFQELVKDGVKVFEDTIAWLKKQRVRGIRTAIISASKNCEAILLAAGVEGLFDVRVDGITAATLNLKGKPAPDIFLEAASQLNVKPGQAAVFEDALAGVKAGKAGGFALVVGINRDADLQTLKDQGADLVITEFPTEL